MDRASGFLSANIIAKALGSWGDSSSTPRRLFWRFLEGTLYTGIALLISLGMGLTQAGVFAVFLTAAGPTGRFEELLAQNRQNILLGSGAAWKANAVSAGNLLALFMGLFVAFAAASLWLGEARMGASFEFMVRVGRLGNDTILTRSFAGVLPLFGHNALVLLVFFALAFVYRAYGALLALAWNAGSWGLVLAFLVRRGMTGSGVAPALFIGVSAIGVLPHLILEAAGYVLASLAAIFLSKCIFKYPLGSPIFTSVLKSVAQLLLASVLCLLVGAVVESVFPHFMFSLIRR